MDIELFLKEFRDISTVESARVIPLNNSLLEKLPSCASERARKNSKDVHVLVFRYVSQGRIIAGFAVIPSGEDVKNHPLPVIIYNRGGYGDFGIVKSGKLFTEVAELAKQGYFVIGSQYPGNGLSEGKDEWGGRDVEDVLALFHILEKFSIADEKKIGMYGFSRGGMETYRILAMVDWVRVAVVAGGESNLVRTIESRPEMQEVFDEAFSGGMEEKIRRSAFYWPEKISSQTPILLMHGSADWRVSPLDSIELATAFYKNKKPCRFVLFEGADHNLTEHKTEAMILTKEWFDLYLKKNESLPDLNPHGK